MLTPMCHPERSEGSCEAKDLAKRRILRSEGSCAAKDLAQRRILRSEGLFKILRRFAPQDDMLTPMCHPERSEGSCVAKDLA